MAYERGNYASTVKNSVILMAGTVVGVLIVGGMGGYALAKIAPLIPDYQGDVPPMELTRSPDERLE